MPLALRYVGPVLALLAALAAPASAQLYRWVDKAGNPHFTNHPGEVPPEFRSQLEAPPAAADPAGDSGHLLIVPGLNKREEGAPVRPMSEAEAAGHVRQAMAQLDQSQAEQMISELRSATGPVLPWVIGGVLVFLLVNAAFGSLILKLACRICGEATPGFGKAMGIVSLQALAYGALGVLLMVLAPAAMVGVGAQAGQFGLGAAINTGILRGLHCDSTGKALAVTVMVWIVMAMLVAGIALLAVCAGVGASLAG